MTTILTEPAAAHRAGRWGALFGITVLIVLAAQTVLVWSIDLDLRAIRRRMLHGASDKPGAVMKPDHHQGGMVAP